MREHPFTSNQLKAIAVIAMFFDHFVSGFIPHSTVIGLVLRTPGRIVAPIMCYMIAEGYHHTSSRKKYILRLLLFSLLSHVPYDLYFGFSFLQATSVMWSLTMGLTALTLVKRQDLPLLCRAGALAVCCALSVTANWNYVAVLWIVLFGCFYQNFKKQMIGFVCIGAVFHLIPTYLNFGPVHEGYPHWYQLGIFLPFWRGITERGDGSQRS